MIIGLDVGGTHTDVVLLNREGVVRDVKVGTDTSNLFGTVLAGLEKIMSGIGPETIKRVVLSTTLTTNAIVQQKIPEVAIIVSSGPGIDPRFFQPNELYYPVAGSIDHRGREVQPVDPGEIERVARELRTKGIRHVGVIGKFSVRNPAHELQIKTHLGNAFERVFMGHRISGHLNFPRRIATTYLNASVYPIHKEFFEAVQRSLEARGLTMPIRILKADGGNLNFASSIEFPGQTILSGPAASVMGALAYAPENVDSLVLDIGGTTTDMTVLMAGVPLLAPLGIDIGGYRTLVRSLDTRSIGIGGDSLVRLSDRDIEVGPERIGPAMAYGGPKPTPTDALFVLNKVEAGDREKSVEGLAPIAAGLGLSVEEAAQRIFKHACSKILQEASAMVERLNSKPVYTIHEIQEGCRLKPQQMLILGGPAPYFGEKLEQLSGMRVAIVPKWSVANAIGAALARTTSEVTLFADTEQGIAIAPGVEFRATVGHEFNREKAVRTAFSLLKNRAVKRGANPDNLEMEVIEEMEFNIVRGFNTTGKHIRIRAQVKPGLIAGYEAMVPM
ncbi:MAG: hydantoinase/oxoprolinase family protein [Deltaproteobacteria bacterium]|nr:hydantoinase/oxoprolinase family protein [Deltaproteobacteria bacterium]